jgi:hypothetical protein
MTKCDRIVCLWWLYSFDFSQYTGQKDWERVKKEREDCPKDCDKYVKAQAIKKEAYEALTSK